MNPAPSRELLAAVAACALALLLFAGTLLRAVTVSAGGAVAAGPVAPALAAGSHGAEPLSMEALLLAVESDPFRPDRRRAAARYRLPGDVDPPPPPPPPEEPTPPPFRLLGTAIAGETGLALVQLADAPARLLATGEWLAGYRLHQVTSQSATMVSDERSITLLVPGPQAQRVAAQPAPQPGRGAMMGRGGQQPQAAQVRMSAAEAALAEAVMERARQSGATEQMVQMIQRMIQERGLGAVGDINIESGRMIIRSADGRSTSTMNTGNTPPPAPPIPPRPRPDTLSAPLRHQP
jgi:hypothetical protein